MGDYLTNAGASIIMGGLNTVGGILNNAFNNNSNLSQNAQNRYFTAEQNQLSREFAAQQQELAQQYNTSERLSSQQYNSMPNQVNLLRQAGINPAVYFGAGKSGSVSTPASVSPASAPASAAPAPIPMQAYSGFPQLMSSAAEMIQALSGAKKSGLESASIEAQLPFILEQLKLGNEHQQYQNLLTKTKANFEAAHVPERAQELFAQIQLLKAQEYSALKQGVNFEASAELSKVEGEFKQQLKQLNYWQSLIAQNEYDAWDTMNQLKIKNIQSETSRNVAQAQEARSASRLNLANATSQEIGNEIQKAIKDRKIDVLMSDYARQLKLTEKEQKELTAQIHTLQRVDSNMFFRELDSVLRWITSRAGVVLSGNASLSSSTVHKE